MTLLPSPPPFWEWWASNDAVRLSIFKAAITVFVLLPTANVLVSRSVAPTEMEKGKPKRRPNLLAAIFVEMFGHFCIAHMCFNVMFDLLVLTPPLYLIRPFSVSAFQWCTTQLIYWTTPIVLAASFSWCGTRVYINDKDLMERSKMTNLLALANHGSRVDWLIGMYVGYCGYAIRVGFLCEWLIKYLPLIGWYRNWVCEDLFLVRSFKQDKEYIVRRLRDFKDNCVNLMILLAPEGVIVDKGEAAMSYVQACNDFCKEQGYPAFEYVLTPRYKGMTCLQEHVSAGGTIISCTMAFRQGGKLLNEKLRSEDRVVPDLYSTFAGVGGDRTRVDMFITELPQFETGPEYIKKALMDDYHFKDTKLKEMHSTGEFKGCKPEDMQEYEVPHLQLNVVTFFHNLAWVLFSLHFCVFYEACFGFLCMFALVCMCTTFGKSMQGGATMESIPFETGIKAVMMWAYNRKLRRQKSNTKLHKEASTSQTAY